MSLTIETGARAERAAVEWLRREGFLIMDTNWRSGHYELDIVAQKGDTIHFVEVKCRRAGSLTTPEEAVTSAKAKYLIRAANDYILSHGLDMDASLDLVAVDMMPDGSLEIRYIPHAIEPRW